MFSVLSKISSISLHRSMNLTEVVSRLQKFAPTCLAESWDNVGLLIEPSAPHVVTSLMLTNDLTLSVLQEAIDKNANMILSYHPPLFKPFQRLTQSDWKQRIAVQCIENRIAVYSPHTAYDALAGGVNDWLIKPFGGEVHPIHRQQSCDATAGDYSVRVIVTMSDDQESQLTHLGANIVHRESLSSGTRLHLLCKRSTLSPVCALIKTAGIVGGSLEITKLEKLSSDTVGSGRITTLSEPITIQEAVERVKQHLKLPHVRLALARKRTIESKISSVAVCAGSGSSVLAGVSAGVYITGEMSHHEVLQATQNGRSVILCEHSNTERGYLATELRDTLTTILDNQVQVLVSQVDQDPLVVV